MNAGKKFTRPDYWTRLTTAQENSTMRAQEQARVHRFHDLIAISFTDSTDTMYITPKMAKTLASELRLFAKHSTGDKWPSTRIIDVSGGSYNECNGQKKHNYI